MVTMFKSTPLADQWASRNQAKKTSVIVPNKDDQMSAEGILVEFDDNALYRESKEIRHLNAGINAYKAFGDQAELEDGLIAEACQDTPAGRRAEAKLASLGYAINGDFDAIRSSNREFLSQHFEECE
jgi:hypothetical protein